MVMKHRQNHGKKSDIELEKERTVERHILYDEQHVATRSSRKQDAGIVKEKKKKIGHFFFYLLFSIMWFLLKIIKLDKNEGRTHKRKIRNG